MPSYLKKTSNKNKIPRNKNRSMVSPPMKRKAKKKLAETDKGSYYNQDDIVEVIFAEFIFAFLPLIRKNKFRKAQQNPPQK